jgi:hypothetical protein
VALALAEALGVDAGDWREPLPVVAGPGTAAVVLRESAWVAGHLLPWLLRRALGREPAEEVRTCKRPDLLPVD